MDNRAVSESGPGQRAESLDLPAFLDSASDLAKKAFEPKEENLSGWDTSICYEPEGTRPLIRSPEEAYVILPQAPNVRECYADFLRSQESLGNLIDHQSGIYAQVRAVFEAISEQAGLSDDGIKLDLIRSPEQNAFIMHHSELDTPHVFLTTGLLQALAEKFGVLREGHLAAVIGHEMAHYREGHYENLKLKPSQQREGLDPIPVKTLVPVEQAKDWLFARAFTRDQELRCDELAIRWTYGAGLAPQENVEVLQHLSDLGAEESRRKAKQKIGKRNRFSVAKWVLRSVTSTHPGLAARVCHARGVLRQIEIEEVSKKRGDFSVFGMKASQPVKGIITASEMQSSPVQQVIGRLSGFLARQTRWDESTWNLIDQLVGLTTESGEVAPELGLDQIRHLHLILPALARAAGKGLPFLPYGALSYPAADKKLPLTTEMSEEIALRLERVMSALEEHALELIEQERQVLTAADRLTPAAEAELAFKRWWAIGGAYNRCNNEEHFYGELLGKRLPCQPVAALELIDRYGKQSFDFKSLKAETFEDMLNVSNLMVKERGAFFAELQESGELDVRTELFTAVLEADLLEGCRTISEVVSFVTEAEKRFGGQQFWERAKLDCSLGENIAIWASSNLPELNTAPGRAAHEELIEALRKRPTVIAEAGDKLLIEVSAAMVSRETGLDIEQRKHWISENYEPGRERDMLVFKLLESETRLFQENYQVDAEVCQTAPDLERDNASYQDQFRRQKNYAEVFEKVADLLDLSWFEAALYKGDLFSLKSRELQAHEKSIGKLDAPESKKLTREAEDLLGLQGLRAGKLFSPVLLQFVESPYCQVHGPLDYFSNTARFYTHTYLSCMYLVEPGRDHGAALSRKLKRAGRFPIQVLMAEDIAGRDAQYSVEDEETRQLCSPAAEGDPYPLIGRALICSLEAQNKTLDYGKLEDLYQQLTKMPAGEFRDYIVLQTLAAHFQHKVFDAKIRKVSKALTRHGKEYMGDDYSPKEFLALREEGLVRGNEAIKAHNAVLEYLKEQKLKLTGDCPLHVSSHDRVLDTSNGLECVQNLLSLLRSPEDVEKQTEAVSGMSLEKVHQLEQTGKIYRDYLLYLRHRIGAEIEQIGELDRELSMVDLRGIANLVGHATYQYYSRGKKSRDFKKLGPAEKIAELLRYYPYSCEDRDSELMRVIAAEESRLGGSEGDACEIYRTDWALEIYDLLYSPAHRNDLGRQIFRERCAHEPELQNNLEARLTLLLRTHPQYSVSREQELKSLFDGDGSGPGHVKTWEDRDSVQASLDREQGSSANTEALKRSAGVLFLEEAVNDLDISARERVDTVLWMVGLKGKSHLVDCYEAVAGLEVDGLKKEADKLSEEEKRTLVKNILSGPKGVLRDNDPVVRKEFLDTLFFSVFSADRRVQVDGVSYLKSVYDTMLNYIEPERAADALGNFLVCHLEGKDFNQKVKVFFESFGFVGIKVAQYLVSSTTLLPEDMREVLMDLTSRVSGPDKRVVFELAEQTYGKETARNLICSVGERVGGGSFMSFYEVELWNSDHTGPGRKGVVGILRPDIVKALPEDLHLVHRLIQTMEEMPELYGGKTVSMDLMENLMWQSLTETNLNRTQVLQGKMRRQIRDPNHPDVTIEVPEVWQTHSFRDADGKMREIALNQGPFIFMDRAEGVTLDCFRKQCAKEGAAGAEKMTRVANRVAEVFFDQLSKHGLVHCDLHPGNMLVREVDGRLHVTILDVGLSTELDPEASKAMRKLLRMAIGQSKLTEEKAWLEKNIKNMFGVGEVKREQGLRWIGEMLNVFESMLEEHWDDRKKAQAAGVIWDLIDDRKRNLQGKITQIMDLTRRLDLHLPREFYYILRAVSVMDHIWREVDWSTRMDSLQSLREIDDEPVNLPDIDVEPVVEKVNLACRRLDFVLEPERVRGILNAANAKTEALPRFHYLRESLAAELQIGERQDNEEKVLQLLDLLCQDLEFREQMGLSTVFSRVNRFFSGGARARQAALAAPENMFVASKALPQGLAQEQATRKCFGELSRVWRDQIEPATLVRTLSANGTLLDHYIVLLHHRFLDTGNDDVVLGLLETTDDYREVCYLMHDAFGDEIDERLRRLNAQANIHEYKRTREEDEELEEEQLGDIKMVYFYYYEDPSGRWKPIPARLESDATLEELGIGIEIDGDENYVLYCYLRDSLIKRYRGQEGLSKLMAKKDQQVQIRVDNKWRDISELLIQKGESRAHYHSRLQEERERLAAEES